MTSSGRTKSNDPTSPAMIKHNIITFVNSLELGYRMHSHNSDWTSIQFWPCNENGTLKPDQPALCYERNKNDWRVSLHHATGDGIQLIHGPMQWDHPRIIKRIQRMHRYIIALNQARRTS